MLYIYIILFNYLITASLYFILSNIKYNYFNLITLSILLLTILNSISIFNDVTIDNLGIKLIITFIFYLFTFFKCILL